MIFLQPVREKVTGTFCAKPPKGRWRQKVPVTFPPTPRRPPPSRVPLPIQTGGRTLRQATVSGLSENTVASRMAFWGIFGDRRVFRRWGTGLPTWLYCPVFGGSKYSRPFSDGWKNPIRCRQATWPLIRFCSFYPIHSNCHQWWLFWRPLRLFYRTRFGSPSDRIPIL